MRNPNRRARGQCHAPPRLAVGSALDFAVDPHENEPGHGIAGGIALVAHASCARAPIRCDSSSGRDLKPSDRLCGEALAERQRRGVSRPPRDRDHASAARAPGARQAPCAQSRRSSRSSASMRAWSCAMLPVLATGCPSPDVTGSDRHRDRQRLHGASAAVVRESPATYASRQPSRRRDSPRVGAPATHEPLDGRFRRGAPRRRSREPTAARRRTRRVVVLISASDVRLLDLRDDCAARPGKPHHAAWRAPPRARPREATEAGARIAETLATLLGDSRGGRGRRDGSSERSGHRTCAIRSSSAAVAVASARSRRYARTLALGAGARQSIRRRDRPAGARATMAQSRGRQTSGRARSRHRPSTRP